MQPRKLIAITFVLAALLLSGCSAPAPAPSRLEVLATTTIVGDVVRQVGGEHIALRVLLPVGADPHGFEPTPQDVARLAQAQIIFANGAGLESFLDRMIASAGNSAAVVHVSEAIELLESEHDADHAEADHAEGEHAEGEHSHAGGDPHTWTDPNLVLLWVDAIESALAQHDPDHTAAYHANAETYRARLRELDAWIVTQVAQIPTANRQIVSDHTQFGYFAARYGFTQVGALIPGYTTLAQTSAQELADLESHIREYGVKAILVGASINQNLARQVAQDTGVRLVPIYTGSLSAADGEAATYLDYMRYNVNAIVEALR